VTAILVAIHLLAAAVWVGGSTALIFVGVPAIRALEGGPRGRAMKELGRPRGRKPSDRRDGEIAELQRRL